jgi:hypothetical protein
MIQPDQYRILCRVLAQGEPVQKTTSEFELHSGELP